MNELGSVIKNIIFESGDDSRFFSDDPFAVTASDYFDEGKNAWAIDAWTRDDEEEDTGTVAAYVDNDTFEVTYMSEEAFHSQHVQEEIDSLINSLKAKKLK